MVVLSSVHVHRETIDAHDNCLQCAGHIESAHHHNNDCLYCTFLSLSYLGGKWEQSAATLYAIGQIATPVVAILPQTCHGVASLRAPPAA